MSKSSLNLYIEINNLDLVFFAGKSSDINDFKILYKLAVPIMGLKDNSISNFDEIFNLIKENIYLIEKKYEFTFKEIIIILENFNLSFLNLSGYQKLNGSQILRENITYIINSLKSYVDKIESKKTIIHIFNSKYNLDYKKIENLPIGLFGDFYSHELSFALINTNDYKNLEKIFTNCNLKIKKILLKSYVAGALISEIHKTETFFKINIQKEKSKIFYFENNSLKYEQNFKFGYEIIKRDISKITSLKISTIENIIDNVEFTPNLIPTELIDKKFFNGEPYRKIKKKLIYDIAFARINEFFEIIVTKNVNFGHYNRFKKDIFIEFDSKSLSKNIVDIFRYYLSTREDLDVNFLFNLNSDMMLNTAHKLVHFGWKKEAIPIAQSKKSLISKFFEAIFG